MSGVTCHMSCVTFFFLAKWGSFSVDGLLSMGPTLSSLFRRLVEFSFDYKDAPLQFSGVCVGYWITPNMRAGFVAS